MRCSNKIFLFQLNWIHYSSLSECDYKWRNLRWVSSIYYGKFETSYSIIAICFNRLLFIDEMQRIPLNIKTRKTIPTLTWRMKENEKNILFLLKILCCSSFILSVLLDFWKIADWTVCTSTFFNCFSRHPRNSSVYFQPNIENGRFNLSLKMFSIRLSYL